MWLSLATVARLFDLANIALVASLVVGVLATFAIIWTGNRKEKDLRREVANAQLAAANANERAAQLENETVRLKQSMAWRQLTHEQHDIIVEELKGHPMEVWTTVVGKDPETLLFRNEIDEALADAGLHSHFFSGGEPAVGLSIAYSGAPEYALLVRAFEKAGLPLTTVLRPRTAPANDQYLIIGTKPPPE